MDAHAVQERDHLGLGGEIRQGEQAEHSGERELVNKGTEAEMKGKQYISTTYCVPGTRRH